MNAVFPIIFMANLGIVFFALAVLIHIRSRHSLIISDDSDFIDRIIEKKKRKLCANMGGITWKSYKTMLLVFPVVIGTASFLFLQNKAYSAVFACCAFVLPEIIVKIMANRQRKKFDEKFAMALRSLASALRSGMTLEQAVNTVAISPFLPSDIRDSFRQIASDIQLGIPIADSFQNFAEQSGEDDAFDVAAIIAMQTQVGGSEAASITKIIQNISNRLMMKNEIKALFAETNILVIVMDFLPLGLFLLFYNGAYDIVEPFFSSFSMTLVLIGMGLWTIAGSFVIHNMARSARGD